MEKIIVVEKAEVLQGAKGDYLKVTDKDGKTHNIFQNIDWELFGDGMAVQLTLEKSGRWMNVTGAEPVDIQVDESKITEQQVAPTTPKPASKPAPKEESKNRAFALSYAKDIACAKIQMGSGIPPREILGIAEMFTVYLDKGMPEEALKAYNQIQKQLKGEE